MNQGIGYAVTAAVAYGLWTTFQQLASSHINRLIGAIGISLTAVILGLVLLLVNVKETVIEIQPKGILFTLLAGVCALGIDYFALKTYSSGVELSTAAPIIVGGSIVVASGVGFLLGERVNGEKLLGVGFVLLGAVVLSRVK